MDLYGKEVLASDTVCNYAENIFCSLAWRLAAVCGLRTLPHFEGKNWKRMENLSGYADGMCVGLELSFDAKRFKKGNR